MAAGEERVPFQGQWSALCTVPGAVQTYKYIVVIAYISYHNKYGDMNGKVIHSQVYEHEEKKNGLVSEKQDHECQAKIFMTPSLQSARAQCQYFPITHSIVDCVNM